MRYEGDEPRAQITLVPEPTVLTPAHRRTLNLLAGVRPLVRRIAALLVVGAVTIGPVGCARHHVPDPNAAPEEVVGPTTVTVQNQGFLDVTVYALRGGVRARLGIATGNRTAVFTIPRSLVLPGSQLRFIANPIGGQRQPVSQEILVSPGDEVSLIIPP